MLVAPATKGGAVSLPWKKSCFRTKTKGGRRSSPGLHSGFWRNMRGVKHPLAKRGKRNQRRRGSTTPHLLPITLRLERGGGGKPQYPKKLRVPCRDKSRKKGTKKEQTKPMPVLGSGGAPRSHVWGGGGQAYPLLQ